MPIEPWMDGVLDAETMRAVDAWAIEEQGVPSLELMEAAGAALAEAVRERAGEGPVRVVCGKGNNGGDGLVAARLLRETGHEVEVLLLWPGTELTGDAAANLERLGGAGFRELGEGEAAAALEGSGAVVDAIFGTGFAGRAAGAGRRRDRGDQRIRGAGRRRRHRVGCRRLDRCSRRRRREGRRDGHLPRAQSSAIGSRRAGPCAGELRVAPIGIPAGAPAEPRAGLITPAVLELAPRRGLSSTKFSSGEVLVIGGSRGLTGAVVLSASAAIRAGAGYATVAVPADLEPIFEEKLTEVMSRGFDAAEGHLSVGDVEGILAAAERSRAVVLGPGMGRDEGTFELARELAGRLEPPLVIDADALNAHADRLDSLRGRGAATVITPHEGELARLLGTESAAVAAHRLEHAREAARASGAIVVLKGRRHDRLQRRRRG